MLFLQVVTSLVLLVMYQLQRVVLVLVILVVLIQDRIIFGLLNKELVLHHQIQKDQLHLLL